MRVSKTRLFVGGEVIGGGAGLHGFRKDHVAVVVVYNQDVCVAVAGRDNELSSGIGCDFAGNGFRGCKDVV